jgi:uncharacterized membrane protein
MIARVNALSEQHKGVLFNVCSHFIWGGMAVYFGFMRHIPSQEIATNRGLWSLPIAAIIVWWLGQWRDVWAAIKTPKYLAILTLTGFIIVFNWGFYVWSIQVGRALESSLGYFINPLLNVVVGYLFLGERFTRAQMVAIGFAVTGVIVQTFATLAGPGIGREFLSLRFLAQNHSRRPYAGLHGGNTCHCCSTVDCGNVADETRHGTFRCEHQRYRIAVGLRYLDDECSGVFRRVIEAHPLFNGGHFAIYLADSGVPDGHSDVR